MEGQKTNLNLLPDYATDMQSSLLVFLYHNFPVVRHSSCVLIPTQFLYFFHTHSYLFYSFTKNFDPPLYICFFCLAGNLLQCTSTCILAKLIKMFGSILYNFNISLHLSMASTEIKRHCNVYRVASQICSYKKMHRWPYSRCLVCSKVISYVSFVVMHSCVPNNDVCMGQQYMHKRLHQIITDVYLGTYLFSMISHTTP